MSHDHYKKDISHLKTLDVYRVLDLYGVTHPAIQHAVKKLLCAGQRGAKDYERDLREAVDSINRALQMAVEDGNGDIATLCNKLKTCEQRGWPYLPDAGDPPEAQAAVMRSQAEQDDGWIDWSSGERPVSGRTLVEIRLENGTTHTDTAGAIVWGNDDCRFHAVTAYRVICQC